MSPKMIALSILFVFAFQNLSSNGQRFGGKRASDYLGCFGDKHARALPHWAGTIAARRQCQGKCRAAKYRYAGVQSLVQCFCGTNYNRYGSSHLCNANCVGADGNCGGAWANAVYLSYPKQDTQKPEGHMGCYRDQKHRALSHFAGYITSISQCIDECRKRSQPYAGLQNGRECFCGSNYGKYGKSSNCKMLCPKGLTCGGSWANSVYQIQNPLRRPAGYSGCFHDKKPRDLSHFMGYISSIQECVNKCNIKGIPFAGLQSGRECWCGKTYGRYGKAYNCNKRCSKGLICGGDYSNSIYNVLTSIQNMEGYIGCYRDKRSRDFSHFAGYVDRVKRCLEKCKAKRYPYAGVQSGRECWCGKSYGKYGKANNCNKRCPHGKMCGGSYSNSVYLI